MIGRAVQNALPDKSKENETRESSIHTRTS